MTNCCPRPPRQWSGAIGVIARCKRASTVCVPKSRSRRALRSICGEKPKAKGVTRPFKPYIERVAELMINKFNELYGTKIELVKHRYKENTRRTRTECYPSIFGCR